jgi:hypothetical protein
MKSKQLRRVSARKYTGAGDVVAAAAKPVARWLGIRNCAGCAGRQKALNALIPFFPSNSEPPEEE